ncbi:MAG: hypothetical protein CMG01_01545 [Candidatus Marinimicrobia bacterium]|nr:hypothetical protein [Candidatus Neomarinimicrobiota bacterium]|tara:strand:- start:15064 stop:15522 length:459 start_codon:yes stop_codon:yes gene_type:complete
MKKVFKIVLTLVFINYLFLEILISSESVIPNQDYITDKDGIVKMYVNVIGHVNNPGSFLVYDGIDIVTLLALAGGPARGANLKKIKIYNGQNFEINFNEYIKGSYKNNILITPRTTIYIEEKIGSKMFNGTNLVSSLLQLLNIIITIERTQD